MKKIILLFFAIVMIFSLFGCVQKSNDAMEKKGVQENNEAEQQPAVNLTELNKESPEEEYTELNTDDDIFRNIDEVLENL